MIKHMLGLLVLMVLAVACRPITVDGDDRTPPTISVFLNGASGLNAHYPPTGEVIESAVNPDRVFRVEPRNDRDDVQLLFTGRDNESGISRIDARLEVTSTCRARVLGGPVSREERLVFSGDFIGRTPPGESTPTTRVVAVGFDYEDLWRRADCAT